MGAPPMVDGVTAEVKSQLNCTLNAPSQLITPADKKRIFAAENHTLKNETTKAMPSPGSLLGAKYVRMPGV